MDIAGYNFEFQGYDKTMYITRSSSPFLNAQSTTLRGPLVASLFNHSYHKLEVIVENDRVSYIYLVLFAKTCFFSTSCV